MKERAIALDAMGGERMPQAAVEGALQAQRNGVPVVLVGDQDALEAELRQQGGSLPVVHASDVIGMDEAASEVRRRPQASVVAAAREVAEGRASALVSMGHSGATMAASLLLLKRIPGVERPAIVANVPTERGYVALLDVGANADCRPRMLQQFAVMGSHYARLTLGWQDPAVGLMSIGEEPGKGNELTRETYPLLADTPGIRFHGNVEGRDVLSGLTEVIVTDGFTGNVILKLAEGEARTLFAWIKEALLQGGLRARLGAWMVAPAMRSVAARLDPSTYGAQPLLGIAHPSFIGHGSSDARAVQSALQQAHRAVQEGLVPRIAEAMAVLTEERSAGAASGGGASD